ncbi:MAG: glycosyltransferase family 4 protein [Candidatus Micrarchaeota archaeon]
MKIAMLGWEFPPFMSGGLGVHCERLSQSLAKAGVEIDFFMPANGCKISSPAVKLVPVHYSKEHLKMNEKFLDPYRTLRQEMNIAKDKKELIKNVKTKKLKKVDAYNLRVARKIAAKHKVKEYDLIHVHGRFNIGAAVLAKHFCGVPFIWTVHSTIFDEAVEGKPDNLQYYTEKIGITEADKIIAVSNRTKKQLIKEFGAKKSKVSVVYNGIDSENFNVARPIKKERKQALFHGRLTNQKGPKYFLMGARKLLQTNPLSSFVMSGKGHLKENLESFARQLKIKQRVAFPGFISQKKLPQLYANSDVFVLPSISEPFGITVLEAMACGTPVVISKTCGVGEIISNCIKVDYWDIDGIADGMNKIINNPSYQEELSIKGKEEAQKLTWDKVALDTLNIYSTVKD